MIKGVGCDIVEVARIEALFEQYGEHLADKILAESEFNDFALAANKIRFLAKRFAAKEAISKSLGTGFRCGVTKQSITVTHDELGKPIVHCHDEAEKRLQSLGRDIALSLSDEKHYIVAFAVLS